jgi:hypothetical protein
MKKYLAILSMTLLIGSQSGWAEMWGLFQNVSADGSLEAAGQQANNEADVNNGANDHRGAVNSRVRLGFNADVTDGVNARIELARTSLSAAAGAGVNPQQAGSGADTINTEGGIIAIDSLYVDLNDFLWIDKVRGGRQFVGKPGDFLVYAGPYNDDNLSINFLDALSLTKKVGLITLTGVTGKPREGHPVAVTDAAGTGDINVSWITAQSSELIKGQGMTVPLEVGIYEGTNSNGPVASDNNTLTIYDLRAGLNLQNDALRFGLEYAMNGGQQNIVGNKISHKGNALLLNALYDDAQNGFGVHGKFASATGDNKADTNDKAFHDFRNIGWASSDYRYGEILSNSNAFAVATGLPGAGLDSATSGSGLSVINLGGYFVVPPAPKVTLMADYYIAKFTKVASGFSKSIGNEIDLAVGYDHSSNIRLSLGYAMLNSGKGLAQAIGGVASNTSDSVDKLFARVAIKFGPMSASQMTSAPVTKSAPASKATTKKTR